MSTLQISLLGPWQVKLAGQLLSRFPTAKVQALLGYLAVEAETTHTRDTLVGLFWSDYRIDSARQNLRKTLQYLRQMIPPHYLQTTTQTVQFNPESDYCLDVTQFTRLISACRQHSHTDIRTCSACAERLQEAVALYRGDCMSGFFVADSPAFEEWLLLKREWLRREALQALYQVAAYYEQQKTYERAYTYAWRQIELDPMHEEAHQQIMRILALSGRRSEALAQYETCRRILAAELAVEPAQETVALYEQIRRGVLPTTLTMGKTTSPEPEPSQSIPAQAVETVPHPPAHHTAPAYSVSSSPAQITGLPLRQHNLYAQTASLVGREAELAELQHLFERPDVRLVTILGAGGMGKTHLAQEMARRYLDRTHEQVFFVALASVAGADGLTTAIIDALGYPLQPDRRSPEQQLRDYLQHKQMLLVLDNFEHLLTGIGLVNEILHVAPRVKILATSRERLLLSSETLYVLRSLAYPDEASTAGLLDYAAVKLFIQRACHSRPTFEPNAADYAAIARICLLVEGMPLAILLAAAWVNQLSVQVIANEISQSLDFLESDLRDLPERHRSIRAVFAHSRRRLTEVERTVFRQLAVFRGGFTRQAAERVAGASLHSLRTLVNQSLLQVEQEERYTLHELLRQYAETELEAAQQSAATRERHCAYYVDLLARRAGDLKGPLQAAALAEIETEHENVRLAWQWAVVHANSEHIAKALESLGFFYEWRGRFQEGKRAFAQATARFAQTEDSTESHILVRLLIWQAKFGQVLGDRDDARRLLRQAQACLNSLERIGHDTRPEQAVILHTLGQLANERGEPQIANPLFEQSLALFQALGDAHGKAGVLIDLGRMSRDFFVSGSPQQHRQQTEEAKQMNLASLAIYRAAGDQANLAKGLWILGSTCLVLGQADEAEVALEECLAICQELGTISSTFILALAFLGAVKQNLGLYKQMRSQGERVLGLAQEVGDTRGTVLAYELIGRAALTEKRYAEAQHWLQQSMDLSNQSGRTVGLNFTLVATGLASYGLGDPVRARQQLSEAIQISLETHSIRGAVYGLLLGALLLADQGKRALAVELHTLAMCYPFVANSRWCADVAGHELTAIAESLPAEVVAAARVRGQASDLWVTMASLLVELGHFENV